MEQSATKRRKLSPSTSVTATSLNTSARPTSRDGVPGLGHRASFMSPTKASLSRFNPGLLPSARSSEPQKSTSKKSPNIRTRTLNVNSEEGGFNGATGTGTSTNTRTRTGIEPPAGKAIEGPEKGKDAPTPRNGLSTAPRRRSQTPNVQHAPLKFSQTQPVPGLRALPSRITSSVSRQDKNMTDNGGTVATQRDRPRNGVTIDESSMDKLPHTPTRRGVPRGSGQVEGSELSLPSTPSQLGLEAPPERPKGLLFGKANKGTTKRDKGASPSKQKESTPKQPSVERQAILTLGPRIFLPGLPRPAPTPEQADLQEKMNLCTQIHREVVSSGSGYLEDVLLSSWQNPGGKEIAGQERQRKKLTELSNKLLRLREDIDHLRSSISDVNNAALDQNVQNDGATSSELSTLNPPNLPSMLSLFFPFSNDGNATRLRTTPSSTTVDPGETVKIKNSMLLDHYTDHPEALFQKHDAEFISNGSLLVALQVTVDSKTLEIYNLQLLEQGSFTSQELQTWTLADVRSKQLASIGTAINRCSHVIERRAACWRSCQERLPDLVEPLPNGESVYGQQVIKFQRQRLSLSITWAIRLRDGGEAESKLSITTGFPPAWLDEDIVSDSEGQDVREAFDLLVRERGVTEAIAAIVKLLFQPD